MPIIRDQRMLGVSTLARELGRQQLYLSKIDICLVWYLSSLIFDKFDICQVWYLSCLIFDKCVILQVWYLTGSTATTLMSGWGFCTSRAGRFSSSNWWLAIWIYLDLYSQATGDWQFSFGNYSICLLEQPVNSLGKLQLNLASWAIFSGKHFSWETWCWRSLLTLARWRQRWSEDSISYHIIS